MAGSGGPSRAVKIVNDTEVPADVIAQSIVDLAAAAKKLLGTRLRRDTLILLLHDMSGVGKRDIGYVLNSLEQLEGRYVKPRLNA
jgi:hypothetical protein